MKVLIVEDDQDLRDVVRASLEVQGWSDITVAVDCASATSLLDHDQFDLVILDVHLPDGSGLDLVRRLRSISPDAHAVIVSGAATEDERVAGLAAGADDYVVKPFSVRELVARIAAVDRRRAASSPTSIDLHDLQIDVVGRSVTVGGSAVVVTRREFDLLRHLAESPGRTFTRDELLRAVWGSSSEWQSEATVTEHISRLRRKIETDPLRPSRIVTSRGVGYRFELAPCAAAVDATLADAGDATVVVIDSRIVAATPAALALLRAEQVEDVIGQPAMRFVAPASEEAAQVRRLRTQAGIWPRPELITIRRVDGGDLLVELASTPVTWNGTLATQMTMWDLSLDTHRLRELATGIRSDVADAVIVANAKTEIQSFNPAAEDLYGWRESEVVGRSIFDTFFAGGELEVAAAQEHMVRDGHWHGVVEQHRRDGSAIAVSASVTLVKDGADQPVGFVAVNRVAPAATSTEHRGSSDLARDVRRGLDHGEFLVHYQPVVRLEDGRWLGVEALARWRHPDRGMLLPADFAVAFDHPDLATALGDTVLDAACRQAQTWRLANRDLQVAVNLSARQLTDLTLPRRLEELMAATSMPPRMLWLEVTETSLVQDLEVAAQVARQIEDLGIYLTIDDFGTGWASLTYLRQFDVHALKIDRSFVAELGRERRAEAIVRSVIALGAELDIAVVAEGVETEGQRQRLLQLGCVVGQGYLFGAPRPAEELGDRT